MICNSVLDHGPPESRELRWFLFGEGAQRTGGGDWEEGDMTRGKSIQGV